MRTLRISRKGLYFDVGVVGVVELFDGEKVEEERLAFT